jgi:glutamate synthase (NADPH) large chain
MSGGIAYVVDPDGDLSGRCNLQLVGLETLAEADEDDVRALLAEHLDRTGSTVARRHLDDWDPRRFVKVIPHDYKRALAEPVSTGGVGFLTTETEEAA